MKMSITDLIEKLNHLPECIEFDEVIAVITDNYHYTPAAFNNGDITNMAGSNEGSCKIFAFAELNDLTEAQTLACFGRYYREDVLQHPEGSDHANIRNFMQHGWKGIHFVNPALSVK